MTECNERPPAPLPPELLSGRISKTQRWLAQAQEAQASGHVDEARHWAGRAIRHLEQFSPLPEEARTLLRQAEQLQSGQTSTPVATAGADHGGALAAFTTSLRKAIQYHTASPPESLEKVVHAFLAPAMRGGALRLAPCPVPRLFSFTAVTLETPTAPQQVELLAFRLARRYTDAYLPRREVITPCLYRPFDDITHAMSLEGGAIVVTVEQQRQREFVADFLSNRVAPLYQPLALIAYQEYLALLRLTQGIPLPLDLNHPDEAQRITLQHYKNWLLNFRLNFRFSHASGITMHNAAYEKWRTALSLDPLLHEVTKDVEEVEHYLGYRLNEQQQRWSTFNHVQTGLGILIGTAIALTSFFGMNFEATKNMAFSDPFPVKVAFLAAAIGIAATGIYALIAIGLRRR